MTVRRMAADGDGLSIGKVEWDEHRTLPLRHDSFGPRGLGTLRLLILHVRPLRLSCMLRNISGSGRLPHLHDESLAVEPFQKIKHLRTALTRISGELQLQRRDQLCNLRRLR